MRAAFMSSWWHAIFHAPGDMSLITTQSVAIRDSHGMTSRFWSPKKKVYSTDKKAQTTTSYIGKEC